MNKLINFDNEEVRQIIKIMKQEKQRLNYQYQNRKDCSKIGNHSYKKQADGTWRCHCGTIMASQINHKMDKKFKQIK